MKDYFLRAETRQQIDQALQSASLLIIVDGELITSPEIKALVYVGQIPEKTGSMIKDEDGNEYPESILSDEYHVNLRGKLTPEQKALLPIIPEPKNPRAIFAGGILR